MKKHIITAKIKVDEDTIRDARKWEKRRNYKYGDDVGQLVLDYLMSDKSREYDLEEVEIDEE